MSTSSLNGQSSSPQQPVETVVNHAQSKEPKKQTDQPSLISLVIQDATHLGFAYARIVESFLADASNPHTFANPSWDITTQIYSNGDESNFKLFGEKVATLTVKFTQQEIAAVIGTLFERFRKAGNIQAYEGLATHLTKVYGKLPQLDDSPLTPSDTRVVVSYLKAKGALNVDCIVCDSLTQVLEHLSKITKEPGDARLFLIGSAFIPGHVIYTGKHMFPIYIEKNSTGIHLIITDSIELPNRDIANFLNLLGIKNHLTVIVYLLGVPRQCKFNQKGHSGFPLRDIVELSRIPNLLETVKTLQPRHATDKDYSSVEYYQNRLYILEANIPALMKSSQFVQQIDTSKYAEARIVTKKHPEGETLMQFVDRHIQQIVTGGGSIDINAYIEQRTLKYKAIIIEKAITSIILTHKG